MIVVVYTYLGYAALIYVLARWWPYKKKSVPVEPMDLPEVTLFIAAYNEADNITLKMDNCRGLDYPPDKLRILWVIDGSTDESAERLRTYEGVEVVYAPDRRGKTAAVNHGMQFVGTSIVVFSDANCLLNREALRDIVAYFHDPEVGCVSGEKRIAFAGEDTVSSKGEGIYWKYESLLKKLDFQYYSAVGAAGELFAIRRQLFTPLPEDTLLDDFMLSMRIAQQGYRIAYTPSAYAVERGSLNMEEEAKRKRRIAAGGWQSITRLWPLWNLASYGRLSFQYISHRVLRWSITPLALFAMLPLAFVLAVQAAPLWNVYNAIFVFQVIFYVCALAGYWQRNQPTVSKVFYVPYYFIFMNINVLLGFFYLQKKGRTGAWEKSRRK